MKEKERKIKRLWHNLSGCKRNVIQNKYDFFYSAYIIVIMSHKNNNERQIEIY